MALIPVRKNGKGKVLMASEEFIREYPQLIRYDAKAESKKKTTGAKTVKKSS